ncbi:MAG: hypothetical protein CVU56_16860 [Deltaproteobacteria bacterium HGW-Deltaproteobacteria-14]|jgi:hypothetical protein|nr:MAG: hypothetical protein CVU56_16860 [Deltaproteobacteria bacterium HGW-Deltaproteobacteria-14]
MRGAKRVRTSGALLMAFGLALAAACGDGGGGGDATDGGDAVFGQRDGDDGDTSVPSDTTTPGDTLAADTAPPDSASPDTVTGPSPVGVGVIIGEIDSEYVNVAFAAARFTRTEPPPDTSGTVYGPCRVTVVDPNASDNSYGLDAGTVTVSNTTPAVTLSAVSEGVFGTGYRSSLPDDQRDLLPGGGAIVLVAGAGGADIGAFSGAFQMPEPVSIALPQTGLTAEADPSKALTVIWNAGTGVNVLVSLSPVSASGQPVAGKGVLCLVAGDPGQVTVPSEALTALITGSSAATMALAVTRTKTGSVSNATHKIPLTATRSSAGPITLRY